MSTGPQSFLQSLSFQADPMFHFHHYSQENDKNSLAFPHLNLNNSSNKSDLFDYGDPSPFNKDPQTADLSDSFFDTQDWNPVDQISSPSCLSPLEENFYGPKQQHEYDDMIKDFLLSGVSENSKTILKKSISSESRLSSVSNVSQRKKRQTWTRDEDRLVTQLVEKHGQKWKEISKRMANRNGKQIRDRYINVLMPNINKSSWTAQEDELILSLYEERGSKWRQIALELQGRTESQIKNRFYTNLKALYTKRSLKKAAGCEAKFNKSPLSTSNVCETSSTCLESPVSCNSFEVNRKAADFVDKMFSFS